MRILGAVALAAALCACPRHPRVSPVEQPIKGSAPLAPHEGRPYDIVSSDSLLTIRAYRAGPLAKAGHNHVIASHGLRGTLYVPGDLLRTSFELRFAVAELTVDEQDLRREEQDPAEFPPDVPDAAKEGTRHNMLSDALLDGARYPEIVLRAESLERAPNARPDELLAHVQAVVRGHAHSILVPVRYVWTLDRVVATGELTVKQSELGLIPFSALLGALQVQDEMKIRFRIIAHPAT